MFFYQLKNEIWKLFGKKRTYIGFAMFMLAQALIVTLLRYLPSAHRSLMHTIEKGGYTVEQYLSTLSIASLMALVLAYTLLPLYVALVGGDMVSKEAEDGTLRMILCRPVSRARLLCLKWLAGVVFSIALAVILAAGGLFFSSLYFPFTGGLFVEIPEQGLGVFTFSDGLGHFLLAHGFLIVKAVTIMSLSLMFSCFNMKPAAAAILSLSIFLIDRILMEMPYFHDFQQFSIDYHLNVWQQFFQQHIPWWQVGESLGILFGLNLTFLIIGISVFQVRDIKS